ncbi:MAG: hypothetical protein ACT4O3_06725 [Elusimicrobiota bacterium]
MEIYAMTRSPFFVDVASVLAGGDLDEWQSSFRWPVPFRVYQDIFMELIGLFRDEIDARPGGDRAGRDLLMITYKIAADMANLYYCRQIVEKVRQAGGEIRFSETSTHYRGLTESGRPVRPVNDVIFGTPAYSSSWRGLHRRVRNFAKSMVYSGPGWFSNGKSVLAFQTNTLCEAYVKHLGRRVRFSDAADILASDPEQALDPNLRQVVEELAMRLVPGIVRTAGRHGVSLTPALMGYINDVTRLQLEGAARDYAAARGRLVGRKPVHLFTGCVGGYYRRTLSAAVRSAGGTVTSFEHGGFTWHGYGHEGVLPMYLFNNFATTDAYGVHSDGVAARIRNLFTADRPSPGERPYVFAVEDGAYARIWRRRGGNPPAKTIRSVMLVGSCFMGEKVLMDYVPDLIRLDLELRILKTLSHAGHRVLYKQHPGSALDGALLPFNRDDVTVVTDPFEAVMDEADAYVFALSATSTFAPALCTRKPVVYLHADERNWEDDLSCLAARCRIVPTWTDDRNRVLFDENTLVEAVARKADEPDDTFARKWVLSGNSA